MTAFTPRRLAGRLAAGLLVVAIAGGLYLLLGGVLGGVLGVAAGRTTAAVATALVALAFLPGCRLATRTVDRLVHRRRPPAYGVLTRLAALPAGAFGLPDLTQAAEAIGTGLHARLCTVTVRRPGLRDRTYSWTPPGTEPPAARVDLPVRHGGEDVGTVTLDRATVAGLDERERQLLDAVVGNLGALLQAVRARIGLERQLRAAVSHATGIAAARRRAVADADSERRRIERDLHDGVQHQLVTLSLALGLAEHEAVGGRTAEAVGRLERVLEGLDAAEAELARTATGVSAPELARSGVVAALRAELAGDDGVLLDTSGLDEEQRLGAEVEDAVYFCCLESVNNARKHAPGTPVRVRLERDVDRLLFTVSDGGPGFDPAAVPSGGRGLRNTATRMASVGGSLTLRTGPGEGTTVEGWAPLAEAGAEAPPLPAGAAPAPAPAPAVLEQARVAMRKARDAYHGTTSAEPLTALARWLDEPPRIAVVGPAPTAVGVVVERLESAAGRLLHAGWSGSSAPRPVFVRGAGTGAELLAPRRLAVPAADGVVLVLPADGVAGVRGRASQTVVVSGTEDDLGDLVRTRLLTRVEAFRARRVVEALTWLLHESPAPRDERPLRYELDRIRSGASELVELDVLDTLAAGVAGLAEVDRAAAERLLGRHGTEPRVRLGCSAHADPGQLASTAREQLSRWQQLAAHPATTAAAREVAWQVVRACERLLPTAG